MASIDFSLSLREQLYVLPETELITKEEKDILLEFKRVQYAIFFKKETITGYFRGKGVMKTTPSHGNVEDVLKGNKKKNITFEIAADNLLNVIQEIQIKCESKKLIKRAEKIKGEIISSSIANSLVMTNTHNKGFNEREKQINKICTFIDMSLLLDLYPLSETSEKIGINSDTIRQACQDGRIIARRFKNGWSVSLDECREYWAKNETTEEDVSER